MDDTPTTTARGHLRALSGLAVMEAVRDGTLHHGPITEMMGYRVTEVAPGRVVLEACPAPEHRNLFGAIHGGWYGTVLDTAMGGAVMTSLPKGRWYTTLEYRVNVLRPAAQGAILRVTGLLQHGGRSTGVARGEITSIEGDRLFATGSTTCMILDA